ncbi:putative membrane protein [Flavobacterium arsenatis]|uniref:Membrane protein n=1 Tax=Flavobacterium arsenatis TaxID=1484332 RepID=A0ABU1TLN0_9FLAO|nr:hypothetical protein [Flavobacterium arsenatis]MDR6966845.1 putative membrane protein [Flavobacterium arsenatis]
MKALKNIFVGFLVSFIGSIPLGYLNIIGFEVYSKTGMNNLLLYLLGVITIEAIVIYCTLLFADKLSRSKKLMKFIDLFSIIFMLILAYIFYSQSKSEESSESQLSEYLQYSGYLIGIIFSCLNFMQIPFWLGWNVYVVNAKYIRLGKKLNLVYLAGTLIGSFSGIFTVVMILNKVTEGTNLLSKYLLSHIIPLFFVGMAFYQAYKFYKKYY